MIENDEVLAGCPKLGLLGVWFWLDGPQKIIFTTIECIDYQIFNQNIIKIHLN